MIFLQCAGLILLILVLGLAAIASMLAGITGGPGPTDTGIILVARVLPVALLGVCLWLTTVLFGLLF